MSDIVHGEDVKVEKEIDGVFYEIGCGTDAEFETSTLFIGKTTRATGTGWAVKRRARMHDCRGRITGVTKTSNDNDILSIFHFLEEAVRMTEGNYRFTFENEDGDVVVITMTAYVELANIKGNINDFSEFDLNILGTGGFSMTTIAPPDAPVDEEIFSDYWVTVEGQLYINGDSAINSYNLLADDITILEVDREGVQYDIITSGTPGNRQCKYDASTGRITFADGFNAGETVFVLFKVVG